METFDTKRQFLPCSGQRGFGRGKRDWGIRLARGPVGWRARDKSGRQRKFASYEAAERAAQKLQTT